MSDKHNDELEGWDLSVCPLRNKQCLRDKCAWWLKEAKECAVTKIALSKN